MLGVATLGFSRQIRSAHKLPALVAPLSLRWLIGSIAGGKLMASTRSLDAIIASLGGILATAPQSDRQRLAEAIEAYAMRFPIALRDLQNGHPAQVMRELFREVVDAVDARPMG